MNSNDNGRAILFRIVRCIAVVLLLGSSATVAAAPLFENLATRTPERIEDHRRDGEWLVVMIWASDCEICQREIGAYQRFDDDQPNARVVGLTLDGEARRGDALEFVATRGVRFENLIGEPGAVTGYYQIATGSRWIGTPSLLIFGPDGELMAKQAGAVPTELIAEFIAANTTN